MKTVLSFVFVALLAMPVMAEDGRTSQSSLARMGLGKMASVSDEEGAKVRGGAAFSFSAGFVFGGFSLPPQFSANPTTASTISFGIGNGAIVFGGASASTN